MQAKTWFDVHKTSEGMPFALQIMDGDKSQKYVQLTQQECMEVMKARRGG